MIDSWQSHRTCINENLRRTIYSPILVFRGFLHKIKTTQSSEKSHKINTTESQNGSDNFHKNIWIRFNREILAVKRASLKALDPFLLERQPLYFLIKPKRKVKSSVCVCITQRTKVVSFGNHKHIKSSLVQITEGFSNGNALSSLLLLSSDLVGLRT